MKTQVIIGICGEDYDGLINQLTVKTKALGGKWLANKLTHLDGYIAGLLKMEIDKDQLDAFKTMTSTFTELRFSIYESIEKQIHHRPPVRLTIEGEDRSGLTSEITQLLYDQDVHLLHFQSQRFPVVGLGTGVFEATLDIEMPETLTYDTLKTRIEALDSRMKVFLTDSD